MEPNQLRFLLLTIIDGIGRKTEKPVIDWKPYEYVVQVDGRDQGRMIGRKGIVFWAINTLFRYAGIKACGKAVRFTLLEPKERDNTGPLPFKPNPHWDRAKLHALLLQLLGACFSNGEVKDLKMVEPDEAEAQFQIRLDPKLKSQFDDPSLTEAIETIIGAAAKSDGCKASTQIQWG
jgi:predicted RNA-binding protein YlqC (UPF0109 family)